MSKSFYVNVIQWGNNLLVRSIRNGLHEKQKIKFQPTLFTSSNKANISTKWKTLYGTPVYELHPGEINDCKEFIKTHEGVKGFDIFGQTNYALQYVAQQHPEEIIFDSDLLKIVTIDIETAVAETGEFPHPKYVEQEILLITLRDNKTKATVIFGARPYTGKHSDIFVLCRDEKDLLRRFLTYWQSDTPDIITGWNIDMFDIPYIVNRIQKVLGNGDHNKLSPWNIVSERSTKVRGTEELTFDIAGVSSLDYLVLYKKYTYHNQPSYKLDAIAEVELGEKKLDHSEWNTFREFYLGNWEKFTDYNYHDVLLVDKLDDKLKLMDLHLTMAYKAKTNYIDALSPVKLWDAIIYNDLLHKNVVIPNKTRSSKNEKFEGAFVKDPITGKHRWVAAFDLQSLYPHIMMGSNISPETITDLRLDVTIDSLLRKDSLPEIPYAVAGNGWCYSKDKQGFLPELMETMYNSRAIYKKQMIKVEQEYEKDKSNKQLLKEISRLTNLQLAVKIALNSLYGSLGNQFSRYYDLRLAESITSTGQLAIKWIANSINAYMNTALKTNNVDYILMSDTDSVIGSTVILVDGKKTTIEDYYDSMPDDFIKNDDFNEDWVKRAKGITPSVSKSDKLEYANINYVMKHRVKKRMYSIKSNGKEVIVTEDHSVIVKNKVTGEIASIKPKELNSEIHFIINVTDTDKLLYDDDFEITDLGIQEQYVYDIEVEKNHNFFGNDICVHNSIYLSMETLVERTQQGKTTEEKIQFMDKFCDKILTPYIERSYQELADYLGSYKQKMIMKREVLADVGVIVAKKRYILRVHNSEGVQYKEPKIKIMGLEMIKSSTPKAVQDSLKSTIGIILDGNNEDLIQYVSKIRTDFYKLSVEDIAFPRGVNGLEKYTSLASIYTKGTPIHARGALLYNHFIKSYGITNKYQPIRSGEKIKFIYLKKPNTIRENVIAFPSELPKELGVHKYVDYDLQFEKVFLEALTNIVNPIGWTLQEINSLEGFFM